MYQEEASKSERLFSQLTTAWYNWAVSEMLSEKGVHCWALTAAYYSMVHAARTVISVTRFYRCRFVTQHSEFPRFLAGEEKYRSDYDQSIEELSMTSKTQPSSMKELFRMLHDVLSTFKEARNKTSYEKYIIAHQCRPDVEVSGWLAEICEKASACAASTNQEVSEFVYNYVRSHELFAHYLHHLKQEMAQFNDLLEKETLAMPRKLVPIIDRFSDLIAHVKEPTDMDIFIEKTWGYSSKEKSYEELRAILLKTQKL